MKKTMTKLWKVLGSKGGSRDKWKEKEKKEGLKQSRVHFQRVVSDTFPRLQRNKFGRGSPATLRQLNGKRSMSRFFTEAVSMSFLLLSSLDPIWVNDEQSLPVCPSLWSVLPASCVRRPKRFLSRFADHQSFGTLLFNYRTWRVEKQPVSFSRASVALLIPKGVQSKRIIPAKRLSFIVEILYRILEPFFFLFFCFFNRRSN